MPFVATAKYPGAIAGVADLLNHKNVFPANPLVTLASDIAAGDTSISVSSGTGQYLPSDNFVISIDNEIMFVTSRSTDTLTVGTRGYEGTTAASHASGTIITARVTALAHNQLAAEVNAIETALGINLSNTSKVKLARTFGMGGNGLTFSPNFTGLNGLQTFAACGWIRPRISSGTSAPWAGLVPNVIGFVLAGSGGTAFWTLYGASATYFNMSGWANGDFLDEWMFVALTCTNKSVTCYYKAGSASSLTTGATGSISAALANTNGGPTFACAAANASYAYDAHDWMYFSQALTSANFLSIASDPTQASAIAGSNLLLWLPLKGTSPETDSTLTYTSGTPDPGLEVWG